MATARNSSRKRSKISLFPTDEKIKAWRADFRNSKRMTCDRSSTRRKQMARKI
jgi:hypothetical protein